MPDFALSSASHISSVPAVLLSDVGDFDDCFEPHGRGEMLPFLMQIERNKSALLSAGEFVQKQSVATVLGATAQARGAPSFARQASEHSLRFMEAVATDLVSAVTRKDINDEWADPIADHANANSPVVYAIEQTSDLMLAVGRSFFSVWATMLGTSARP